MCARDQCCGCPWCRRSCPCYCFCVIEAIVSRVRVVALPSNLHMYSKSWRVACLFIVCGVVFVLCLCCLFVCACLMACPLVVVIVALVVEVVVMVVMCALVGGIVVLVLGIIVVFGVVVLVRVCALVSLA